MIATLRLPSRQPFQRPALRRATPELQRALDSALRMGRAGDLLLVFADALTRSWKQIIKFRPEGAPALSTAVAPMTTPLANAEIEEAASLSLDGMIREERGIVFARENDD